MRRRLALASRFLSTCICQAYIEDDMSTAEFERSAFIRYANNMEYRAMAAYFQQLSYRLTQLTREQRSIADLWGAVSAWAHHGLHSLRLLRPRAHIVQFCRRSSGVVRGFDDQGPALPARQTFRYEASTLARTCRISCQPKA